MGSLAENPFWDYSLGLYSQPGVEKYCLGLQQNHGANINLLLLCCWAAARQRLLEKQEIASAASLIASWDRQVVQQLRQLRRTLKLAENTLDNELAGPALREEIEDLELIAERIVQENLYGWWQGLPESKSVDTGTSMLGNINTYMKMLGSEEITEDNVLFQAAMKIGR